eukprot:817536-Rhodomonas_salina.2
MVLSCCASPWGCRCRCNTHADAQYQLRVPRYYKTLSRYRSAPYTNPVHISRSDLVELAPSSSAERVSLEVDARPERETVAEKRLENGVHVCGMPSETAHRRSTRAGRTGGSACQPRLGGWRTR